MTTPTPRPPRVLLIGPGDNRRDVEALALLELSVVVDPYLQVGPASDPAGALDLIVELERPGPGWLLVTSARAYPAWAELVGPTRLAERSVWAAARGWRAGAVGEASARTLPKGLRSAALLAEPATAAGLVAALSEYAPSRALIPQSTIARPELASGLRAAGWEVVARAVYRNDPVAGRPVTASQLQEGLFDALVVRSPSAVRALLSHCVPAAGCLVVAGGPTTARAAAEAGLAVRLAASPSPQDVARATLMGLSDRSAPSG